MLTPVFQPRWPAIFVLAIIGHVDLTSLLSNVSQTHVFVIAKILIMWASGHNQTYLLSCTSTWKAYNHFRYTPVNHPINPRLF
ncbi:hypothetical protein BDZ91DRAFT_749213 [Kalaharituber pfeilii]|nr:hypothetical protein BDZ91DRAFT_749213 [Kalaharituber pfeilii]